MCFLLRSASWVFYSISHVSILLNRQRRSSIPVRSAMESLLLSHTSSTGFPGKCWHLFLFFMEAHITKVQAKVPWRVKLGKWVGQHVQWSAHEKDAHADSTLHDVLQFASKEALLGTLQNFFLPPYCYTRRAEFSPLPFLGVSGMWGKRKQ